MGQLGRQHPEDFHLHSLGCQGDQVHQEAKGDQVVRGAQVGQEAPGDLADPEAQVHQVD